MSKELKVGDLVCSKSEQRIIGLIIKSTKNFCDIYWIIPFTKKQFLQNDINKSFLKKVA